MYDNTHVGFYGNGIGWGLTMDIITGNVNMAGAVKANAFKYNTPKLHYYSIDRNEFRSLHGSLSTYNFTDHYSYLPDYVLFSNETGTLQLSAPIHLPDGAKIVAVTVTVYDGSAVQDLWIALEFVDFSGTIDDGWRIDTKGAEGYQTLSLVSSGTDIIDNRTKTITASMFALGPQHNWDNGNMRFQSWVIAYTLDETQ